MKENSWPDIVPKLRAVIQTSDLINNGGSCQWKTINALTVLQSLIRPFQVFLMHRCIIQLTMIYLLDDASTIVTGKLSQKLIILLTKASFLFVALR